MKFPVPIPPPRRADDTLLPAALVALLSLLLIGQLALPSTLVLPDADVARPLRLRPLVVLPPVVDPVIVQRPLFAPGRRDTPVAGVADVASPLEGARIVGVVAVRGAVRLFIQAPDGKVVGRGLGEHYAGWRLDRLDGNALLASRGAEHTTIAISASAPPIPPRAAAGEQPEAEAQ